MSLGNGNMKDLILGRSPAPINRDNYAKLVTSMAIIFEAITKVKDYQRASELMRWATEIQFQLAFESGETHLVLHHEVAENLGIMRAMRKELGLANA